MLQSKTPLVFKKIWVYVMILLLFPIGAINVLVHRNYWQREERREYIGILVILGYLWILNFFTRSFFVAGYFYRISSPFSYWCIAVGKKLMLIFSIQSGARIA